MPSSCENIESPPTTWQAWLAVLSVAAGTFLLVTSEFLPIGLLTPIADSLDITKGIAGLSVTTPGFVAAFAAPALTLLAGRLDRRLKLLCMTVLICVSNLIVAFASDVTLLLVGRVFLGVAVGGFWTFAVSAGRRLIPHASGARATALISAGISIGMILGVPAGSQLGEWLGWRQAFLANAGLGMIVLMSQLVLVPSLPVHQSIGLHHLRALFTVTQARLGLLTTLFLFAGQFAGYTYLEPFLKTFTGVDQLTLTRLLFTYGLFGIAGNFFAEIAADKSIRRAFIAMSVLLGTTILLGGLLVLGPLSAYLFSAVWGFAFGAIPVCMQIWMYQAAPDNYESGAALFVSVAQIALALGALSGGLMIDWIGPSDTLIVAGVLCLIAALLLDGLSKDSKTNPIVVPMK
ncbi:MFS transporter [Pseudomonas hormoni]|uniref:MFS transporter n=1 Tax=Pseudomonas hormoni TaxID=3093767 RepID=A0ABX8F5D6_9PSED|nr:MFS transporter [Pseudomonas hormoni]QVW26128.1 MFS transporter [Pseudomonas hormoni]